MPVDLQEDLQTRWVPSDDQVARANELIALMGAGVREVYSLHLLVNKRPHVWTSDVVVEHLPSLHVTRATALATLESITEAYHSATGLPVVGGYTVHSLYSDWSVFEDGVSSYPKVVR
jgi:N12 class adenine-specific DNA methylase